MTLKEYQDYNSSFRDSFIYRLGGCTGFFSEYNNLVLAMHYCLTHGLQFVLESEGANFSSGKGWTEFFEPFCREESNRWLKRYNHRLKPVYRNWFDRLCFNIYKRVHPHSRYMYSLFKTIRRQKVNMVYDIPSLGLSGTLLENCSELHRLIWNYNQKTGEEIRTLIKNLRLPEKYAGLHVRRGDKSEETDLFSAESYMKHLQRYSEEKNVFVLTDDYRVLESLRGQYPEYRFFTLCQPDEKGYSLPKLLRMSPDELRNSYLRLWASMDILENSCIFVGTYSANPGMNMGFRMSEDKIKCIDYDKWLLW